MHEGEPFDDVEPQDDHRMRHRGNARGESVKRRIGEPEDFGREDLVFFDKSSDLLGRDGWTADYGSKPLHDMRKRGKVVELLDPVAQVGRVEEGPGAAGSSVVGAAPRVAWKCARSDLRISCWMGS